MARPASARRLSQRTKNLNLLRRRIEANKIIIATISAKARATRTAAERRNLATAREENAVYELILDLGGHIDEADFSPDVDE